MEKFIEGRMPFKGYETYYCVTGECREGKKPLLVLHGGPGSGMSSIRELESQASFGRSVIFYDQLGAGKSEIPSAPHLWKAELWVEELLALVKELKLTEFHLLGHSWGGMLALQTVLEKRPAGIKSLILSSTMASTSMWCKEGMRLAGYLPPDMSQAIYEAEERGVYEGEAYENAVMEFYRRHLCTLDPMPASIQEFFGKPNESYLTAWGPSEFTCSGTLKGWERSPFRRWSPPA